MATDIRTNINRDFFKDVGDFWHYLATVQVYCLVLLRLNSSILCALTGLSFPKPLYFQ